MTPMTASTPSAASAAPTNGRIASLTTRWILRAAPVGTLQAICLNRSVAALYRKYRPQTFDDVVGQEPVVRTLRNAIAHDRLRQAYLFAGPRRTGKTSM